MVRRGFSSRGYDVVRCHRPHAFSHRRLCSPTCSSIMCYMSRMKGLSFLLRTFRIYNTLSPFFALTLTRLSLSQRRERRDTFKKETHLLGATTFNLRWISAISVLSFCGGRAQNTRQCLGSSKPGSMAGSSRRFKIVSMVTPANSGDNSFSFCCFVRAVRWVS